MKTCMYIYIYITPIAGRPHVYSFHRHRAYGCSLVPLFGGELCTETQ